MMQRSKLRQSLPLDTSTIVALCVLAGLFAAMCGLAMIEFPVWAGSHFSPLELSIWVALFISAIVSINAMRDATPETRRGLQVALALLAMIIALQTIDFALDWDGPAMIRHWLLANGLLTATIVIIVSAALIWLLASNRPKRGIVIALVSMIVFQALAFLVEMDEGGNMSMAFSTHLTSTEFLELLCIEVYLLGLILARGRSATPPSRLQAQSSPALGTFARTAFYRLSLVRNARHPPALIAFVPGMTSLIIELSAAGLALYAGGALQKAHGISRWQQFRDMVFLWKTHRIDPPSYYALDLFKPENLSRASEFLTRYETKNGLLHVLNYEGPGKPPKGEMGDKQQFRAICTEAGIATPTTLAEATAESITLTGPAEDLQRPLFCKPRKGMGAMGTLAFDYDAATHTHSDEQGHVYSNLDTLTTRIKQQARNKPMLVQPWLRNHAEIASLADQSLLVFRVVTCLDAKGQPAVALAMLRLLAKLEPKWHSRLPDGEYASPIDIETGVLGRFTGDSPRTAATRYDAHPMTGERITGRKLQCWPEVKRFALRVHQAFPYRTVVGWDIALTPEGPVALEGNSNFDVMFLQRVLDCPMGQSPLSPLLKPHIEALYPAAA